MFNMFHSSDLRFSSISVCRNISGGAVLIVDLTWTGNELARALSRDKGLFYVRIDLSISPFLDILRKYMEMRNATDVTIILGDSTYTDQTLYHLMNNGELLLSVTETLDASAMKKLKKFRPIPSTFAIIANSKDMQKLLKVALRENLVTLPERWNLLFLDFQYKLFDASLITNRPMNLLTLDTELCCQLLNLNSDCDCPNNFNVLKELLRISMNLLVVTLKKFMKEDFPFNNDIQSDFNTTKYDEDNFKRFEMILDNVVGKLKTIRLDNFTLRLQTRGKIEIATSTSTKVIAQYENEAIRLPEHETMTPIKAFYRIGITHALPWSYKMKHPDTGEWVWTGYCVDFAEKLAKKMNFEYEFIEPTKGTFGKKENGIWDGVVGDLASGQTDLAITAIIMTADREEVVDFVAPYFEQSGITIVMRKPVKKTSLFKFMTVLKLEVWLSIVAALIVTGFMVWFLDKYSPYSARNNKKAYLYPCRQFTLKESFWFALTSFTPQGGGEAPKALSGRTLVAAYWLFVVLMLATFTANLAAFLTVERMQAPVQSLEQLARQSRINYTVVKNSDTHKYFINMKYAEDTLYRKVYKYNS
nr:ionotropic receptor 25a [Leptinotarsa decemlineata]